MPTPSSSSPTAPATPTVPDALTSRPALVLGLLLALVAIILLVRSQLPIFSFPSEGTPLSELGWPAVSGYYSSISLAVIEPGEQAAWLAVNDRHLCRVELATGRALQCSPLAASDQAYTATRHHTYAGGRLLHVTHLSGTTADVVIASAGKPPIALRLAVGDPAVAGIWGVKGTAWNTTRRRFEIYLGTNPYGATTALARVGLSPDGVLGPREAVPLPPGAATAAASKPSDGVKILTLLPEDPPAWVVVSPTVEIIRGQTREPLAVPPCRYSSPGDCLALLSASRLESRYDSPAVAWLDGRGRMLTRAATGLPDLPKAGLTSWNLFERASDDGSASLALVHHGVCDFALPKNPTAWSWAESPVRISVDWPLHTMLLHVKRGAGPVDRARGGAPSDRGSAVGRSTGLTCGTWAIVPWRAGMLAFYLGSSPQVFALDGQLRRKSPRPWSQGLGRVLAAELGHEQPAGFLAVSLLVLCPLLIGWAAVALVRVLRGGRQASLALVISLYYFAALTLVLYLARPGFFSGG
jgi:hypothetical protein